MKKKSNLFKIIIAVIAVIIVGGGIFTVLQKEPKQKSYPGVKRYIYFNEDYIDLNTDEGFEKMKEFSDQMNEDLKTYLLNSVSDLDSDIINDIYKPIERESSFPSRGYINVVIYEKYHAMIEQKIAEYEEVAEVREKEKPIPYIPPSKQGFEPSN